MEMCAEKDDYLKYITTNCPNLYTDFGFPCCNKNRHQNCFLGMKEPVKHLSMCPDNIQLKDGITNIFNYL